MPTNEAVDEVVNRQLQSFESRHHAISEMIQRRRLRGGEIIVESRLAEALISRVRPYARPCSGSKARASSSRVQAGRSWFAMLIFASIFRA